MVLCFFVCGMDKGGLSACACVSMYVCIYGLDFINDVFLKKNTSCFVPSLALGVAAAISCRPSETCIGGGIDGLYASIECE